MYISACTYLSDWSLKASLLVVFDRFPNANQSDNFLMGIAWIVAYLNGLRLIKRDSSLFVMVVVVCWLYLISGFAIVTLQSL